MESIINKRETPKTTLATHQSDSQAKNDYFPKFKGQLSDVSRQDLEEGRANLRSLTEKVGIDLSIRG